MSGEKRRSLNENLSRNLSLIYTLRRETEKINLAEFANQLGIGHTTLQNILRQKCNLTLDTVDLIAQRLDFPALQLLADQYPETDLTRGALLLEMVGMCGGLTPDRAARILQVSAATRKTVTGNGNLRLAVAVFAAEAAR